MVKKSVSVMIGIIFSMVSLHINASTFHLDVDSTFKVGQGLYPFGGNFSVPESNTIVEGPASANIGALTETFDPGERGELTQLF